MNGCDRSAPTAGALSSTSDPDRATNARRSKVTTITIEGRRGDPEAARQQDPPRSSGSTDPSADLAEVAQGLRSSVPTGATDELGGSDEVRVRDALARTDPGVGDLQAALAKLVSDLEFNAGLREPPQQTVRTPPMAWSPDPAMESNAKPVVDGVSPTTGRTDGGDVVLIHGRNLHPMQVMFGAAPARILQASADTVTVAAPPADAGDAPIIVTNGDGNYAMAPTPFRYVR